MVGKPRRCPVCGGNLYLEPDLVEATADLVCLQCSRRYRQDQPARPRPSPREEPPAASPPREPAGAARRRA